MISINIFTIILVCGVCAICVINRKEKNRFINLLILGILLDINQIQGYFIKFGTKEVSYEDMYMAFWLVYLIIYMFRHKVKKIPFQYAMELISVATMGILLEMVFPYLNPIICSDTVGAWDGYVAGITAKEMVHINIFRVALIYFRLIAYSFSAVILKSSFTRDDFVLIYRRMVPWLKLPIIYGVFECVLKNIFDSGLTHSINKVLFGLGTSTFLFGEKRNHIYILQGFTREPSHYAFALFFAVIIIFAYSRLNEKCRCRIIDWIYIVTSMVLMIMSGAFSSIIYICVILSLLFILNREKIRKTVVNFRFIIIVILGIAMFFGSFFIAKLDSMNIVTIRLASIYDNFGIMFNNTWHGKVVAYSEIIRFVSIIDTLKDVLHRPIFGLGCGIQWAHSGFVSMLSCIGFLGTFLWGRLSMYSSEKKQFIFLMILLVILPNLLCGFVDLLFSAGMIILLELINVIDNNGRKNNEKVKYCNPSLQ